MSILIDLTGQVYGRLTVLSRAENSRCGRARWLCQCECGEQTTVQGCALSSGVTKSCGCLQRELTAKRHTTHGLSQTPVYKVWKRMIQRCRNKRHKRYKDYGGRGIAVCERWQSSFENFFADMGPRPEGLSLDRINNNKGYSPENCRWATPNQQTNNARSNRRIACRGISQTTAQWARMLGILRRTISWRHSRGWPAEQALGLVAHVRGQKAESP